MLLNEKLYKGYGMKLVSLFETEISEEQKTHNEGKDIYWPPN
jgi:hypothetical protein